MCGTRTHEFGFRTDRLLSQVGVQLLDGDAPRLDLLPAVKSEVDLGNPEAVRVMRPTELVKGASVDLQGNRVKECVTTG
jgi:hypothetical protein